MNREHRNGDGQDGGKDKWDQDKKSDEAKREGDEHANDKKDAEDSGR